MHQLSGASSLPAHSLFFSNLLLFLSRSLLYFSLTGCHNAFSQLPSASCALNIDLALSCAIETRARDSVSPASPPLRCRDEFCLSHQSSGLLLPYMPCYFFNKFPFRLISGHIALGTNRHQALAQRPKLSMQIRFIRSTLSATFERPSICGLDTSPNLTHNW